MNPNTKKYLTKQLQNKEIAVPHRFIYFDEDTDCEASEISGHVIYVELTFDSTICESLKTNYITQVYFWISDDYPFSKPIIMLEDPLDHPLVNFEEINMCNYDVFDSFPDLIMNIYCIMLESLNNNQNENLLEYINK